MRNQIKKKIKEKMSVNHFAETYGIRKASLHDYLNGKKDLTSRVLNKVLKPLDMGINSNLPEFLTEFDSLVVDGKTIKKGVDYNGGKVVSCWGNPSTCHQIIIVEVKKGMNKIFFC